MVTEEFQKCLQANRDFVVGLLDMPESTMVLDAGTGSGRFAISLTKKATKVVAVDSSKEALDRAKEYIEEGGHERIYLVQADLKCSPFDDETFDSVASYSFAHHLFDEDLLTVLVESRRILKPEGRVFVLDHSPASKTLAEETYLQLHLLEVKVERRLGQPCKRHFYTLEELTMPLAKAGFKDIRSAEVNLPTKAIPPEVMKIPLERCREKIKGSGDVHLEGTLNSLVKKTSKLGCELPSILIISGTK